MNDDFKQRLETAAKQLEAMSEERHDNVFEGVRLAGKAEGVRLALSYLREGYAVVALPEPDAIGSDGYHYWDNHDVHCHPGDGVGYICINNPSDEWTASDMRSWAASLLAAAAAAEAEK